MTIEKRLKELNIILPEAPAPAANYVPYVISGNLIYVSGQLPTVNGKLTKEGIVGGNISQEEATESARLCAINILAQVKAACNGDWNKVKRCVKLGIFVACTSEFTNHPEIGNGASNLIANVLGESGKHARFAVGAPSLPRNTPVEIDAIFEWQP